MPMGVLDVMGVELERFALLAYAENPYDAVGGGGPVAVELLVPVGT
jgi:hypothetical protein